MLYLTWGLSYDPDLSSKFGLLNFDSTKTGPYIFNIYLQLWKITLYSTCENMDHLVTLGANVSLIYRPWKLYGLYIV